MALDHDEQVRGFHARIEDRLAFAEVRDVDGIAHEPLFIGIEAIERRRREVECVGHRAS
jgi:hypothetical protein